MTETKSPLMQSVWASLGQSRTWQTHMVGFNGQLKMDISMVSQGRWDGDKILFDETLDFGGGMTQDRNWILREERDGLHIEAEGIDLVEPGFIEGDALVLVYRHPIQGKMLEITDKFFPQADGSVKNMGIGYFQGAAVLKIQSTGQLVA